MDHAGVSASRGLQLRKQQMRQQKGAQIVRTPLQFEALVGFGLAHGEAPALLTSTSICGCCAASSPAKR